MTYLHFFLFPLPRPHPGDGVVDEEDEIIGGDVTRDGLVNSADTDIVGDTNGDGVVDENDTGLVGDANGESFFLCVSAVAVYWGPTWFSISPESLSEVDEGVKVFSACWETVKVVLLPSNITPILRTFSNNALSGA